MSCKTLVCSETKNVTGKYTLIISSVLAFISSSKVKHYHTHISIIWTTIYLLKWPFDHNLWWWSFFGTPCILYSVLWVRSFFFLFFSMLSHHAIMTNCSIFNGVIRHFTLQTVHTRHNWSLVISIVWKWSHNNWSTLTKLGV